MDTKTRLSLLKDYPAVSLTLAEFNELPEYSTSEPTLGGNFFGEKRKTSFKWKKAVPHNSKNPDWFIGNYIPETEETKYYYLERVYAR